jgi:signal transduction histidine kinase
MFFVSVFLASLSLAVGVFALLIGRTPGERRSVLPSSLFIAASGYAFLDALGYQADVTPSSRSTLAGLSVALAAFFLAGTVRHMKQFDARERLWPYTALQTALGLSALACLIPGLAYTTHVTARPLPLVNATYFDTEPTVLGYVVFAVYLSALAAVLARALLNWRRGLPQAGYAVTAFAALAMASVADLLVSLDYSPLPYILPEGIFVASLSFGGALVGQVIEDRHALLTLRGELEARVEERTRELERRTDDLSRAERLATVGRLAAGIAHELNNPAAAIKASLDDARTELARRGGGAELGACIDISLAAVDRVTRIVRQLGAMAGGADADAQTRGGANLGSAVKAAVASARDVTRADVTITTSVDRSLWVRGMGTALEEAISAIIRNAIEAVPDGRAGEVAVVASLVDGTIVLSVRDNGVGMAEPVVAQAFEPFFSTKEMGTSTGLGLSVAKGLVETMGGALTLRSIAGVGTEVTFLLRIGEMPEVSVPRRRPIDVSLSEALGTHRASRRQRVLLVDDDELVLAAMRRYLGRAFDVDTAATVNEGLAKASLAFDAILSDVVMPDGGGERFYLELMERDPALAERVIFVTGGAFRGELQEFLRTQSQPVLQKPVRLSEIQLAVSRLGTMSV